jgi:hypothetical protein
MVVRGNIVRGMVVRGNIVRGMVVRGNVVRGMVVRGIDVVPKLLQAILGFIGSKSHKMECL